MERRRPLTHLTGIYFCIAVYGKNTFQATWDNGCSTTSGHKCKKKKKIAASPVSSSYDTVPGPWSQNTDSTRLRVRERLMAVACSPVLANNSLRQQSSLRQKHEAGAACFSCGAERGLRVPVHTEDPSDSERRGVTRDTRRRTVPASRGGGETTDFLVIARRGSVMTHDSIAEIGAVN